MQGKVQVKSEHAVAFSRPQAGNLAARPASAIGNRALGQIAQQAADDGERLPQLEDADPFAQAEGSIGADQPQARSGGIDPADDAENSTGQTRTRAADSGAVHANPLPVPAPNRTGLPDGLKTGVEALSGVDMSDVRVHRNSGKPAQLDAHAYAQGRDIHLAPGQEEHLPHEAWHVVQQAQGRVTPTVQAAGAAINDDPRLEKEADVMGVKALQEQRAGSDISGLPGRFDRSPVQLLPAWTPRHRDNSLDQFVVKLDNIVNEKAEVVLNKPLEIPETDGYIRRWKDVHGSFVAEYESSGNDLDLALRETPFIYAAYGYAVESLSNVDIDRGALDGYVPPGARVVTQGTRGHTRPDIIVRARLGDIGWFDITASQSETHIQGKTGAGWNSRDYVAEVTYPSLDDARLLRLIHGGFSHGSAVITGTVAGAVVGGVGGGSLFGPTGAAVGAVGGALAGGIGGLIKGRRDEQRRLEAMREAHRSQQAERERQYGVLSGIVERALQNVRYKNNQSTKRWEFENDIAGQLGLEEKLTPQTAKGLIALYAEVNGIGYGVVANSAGYHGQHQTGRNREEALEILYNL